MSEVGAIILTPGLSPKMGAQNKLRLPDDGMPMIGQGDQPRLRSVDIGASSAAHHQALLHKTSIPEPCGIRGNPIVIPHGLRAQLTADLDRPSDYALLCKEELFLS